MLNKDEQLRYRCQLALPEVGEAGQLKLKQARVLCIGAGGLGTVLLQYLAAAGVGTLGIIDDDVIELSNLPRQIIYHPGQVGMKKTLAAKNYLTQLNPAVCVNVYDMKFNHDNAASLVTDYDIIADCTDVLANRYLLNAVSLAAQKPFVFAGISQYTGQCMLFRGESAPCFECLFPYHHDTVNFSDCQQGGVLAVLPGLLGLMQASLTLRHLLQLGAEHENTLHTVDLLSFAFERYRVHQNKDCPACVHGQPGILTLSSITLDVFLQKMQCGESFALLDVRTHGERLAANIGGIHIPLHELETSLHLLNREQPVIVYCHTDKRSAAAVNRLRAHGFTNVCYLQGGMVAVKNADSRVLSN